MKKIGLIGAMDEEVAIIKEEMTNTNEVTKAGMTFVEGDFYGIKTVAVVSGIGKVNMAVCTQILCDDFHVTMVINTGVAGSLNNALDIGDVSPLGDPVGIIPRMEQSIFTADETLVSLAKSACEKANPDIHCHIGKVVSGDQFIASAEKKNYLIETFHGDCAEMEGAAMAHTAYLNNVPFLIIRAISDKADNSGHMDYPVFAKQAIIHTVSLLKELYQHL